MLWALHVTNLFICYFTTCQEIPHPLLVQGNESLASCAATPEKSHNLTFAGEYWCFDLSCLTDSLQVQPITWTFIFFVLDQTKRGLLQPCAVCNQGSWVMVGPGITAELKVSQVRPWSAEAMVGSGGENWVMWFFIMENLPQKGSQK